MTTYKQISYASEKAAVSSSSASKKAAYDVFINYSGVDAQHTLVSSVCTAFRGMGLEVFVHKEVLELGDFIPVETEEAIRTSFLHIAILSPKYAHSPSCLAQLSLMLKIGCTVIPVFYNVEPGNVRDVKGLFADAFEEYEKKSRYASEKLLEWKRALHNVSFHCDEILKGNK
ncbi:hypothetical protein SUGI_0673820 [Cryptomeria japonica]|nr:hypothetical protein SUGI_0673820 [Cryptomeria japonica]